MHQRLKEIRLKNGYSGLDIAKQLGISKVFYHQLETGKRRLSYKNACAIAHIFNLKPDDIFYDDYQEKE